MSTPVSAISSDLAAQEARHVALRDDERIQVAHRAEGFGMEILHCTPTPTGLPGCTASLDTLLGTADVVSLHALLHEAAHDLLGRRELALMKPTAVLVNTSRGPVVDEDEDEDALVDVLASRSLFAAGLDVYDRAGRQPVPARRPPHGPPAPHRQCHHRDSYADGAPGRPGSLRRLGRQGAGKRGHRSRRGSSSLTVGCSSFVLGRPAGPGGAGGSHPRHPERQVTRCGHVAGARPTDAPRGATTPSRWHRRWPPSPPRRTDRTARTGRTWR